MGQQICSVVLERCYPLKEDFQFFWDYVSPYRVGRFLDRWCATTMRSRIEPMKKLARMLRSHREREKLGKKLGRYHLLEKLGSGVWAMCTSPRTSSWVAR